MYAKLVLMLGYRVVAMLGVMFSCLSCLSAEALGSSGQVLVAQHLGPAREAQEALGLGNSWDHNALQLRETARSIAKRVLTLSFGLGVVLMTVSFGLFPLVLPVVCQSTEVADIVSKVTCWEKK